MELMSVLTFIGGLMLSIIGYFLKKTMDELKEVKQLSYENRNKLDVLQVDYKNKIENITEKFDELKLTMSELIKEIKELNQRIK
jgi:hypothetical protein